MASCSSAPCVMQPFSSAIVAITSPSESRLRTFVYGSASNSFNSRVAIGLILTLAISLRVYPLISFAPSTLRIEVRVHPEPSDRQIMVVADGENFYRESGWTIDPEHCPKLFSWPLRDLPAGEYVITAAIGDWQNARAVDRQTVRVQGF